MLSPAKKSPTKLYKGLNEISLVSVAYTQSFMSIVILLIDLNLVETSINLQEVKKSQEVNENGVK